MGGKLIVSLDFELFWGMLDVCTLESYQANVLGGREAIPRLLALFEKYGIHATWATVGFLFGETRQELERYFPRELPGYENKALPAYPWFEKIGKDEQEAPCFYAPSLLRQIGATPGQEIGSHTFSHFYCREPGQTPEQFRQDMAAARAIALDKGFDLRSVVLPRNQCQPEYTEILGQLGFTAYRDEEQDWIHRKVGWFPLVRLLRLVDSYLPLTGHGCCRARKEGAIWNLPGCRAFKAVKPLAFLERLKVLRIKGQLRHAAQKGLTFHLWWHPHNMGLRTGEFLAQLEEIFAYYDTLRREYGMESLTMAEAAQAEEASWKQN